MSQEADYIFKATEFINNESTKDVSLSEFLENPGYDFKCPNCGNFTNITLQKINTVVNCRCGKTVKIVVPDNLL